MSIHQCKRCPPFGRLRVGGTWPIPSGLSFALSLSKHEREGTTIKWNPYYMLTDTGNKLLAICYAEWARTIQYGIRPSVRLLEDCLRNIQSSNK